MKICAKTLLEETLGCAPSFECMRSSQGLCARAHAHSCVLCSNLERGCADGLGNHTIVQNMTEIQLRRLGGEVLKCAEP